MWLKLTSPQQVTINGLPTMKHAGDWIEVRNEKIARLWIAQGKATVLDPSILSDFRGVGIVLRNGAKVPPAVESLKNITIADSNSIDLAFAITILLSGNIKLRPQYLPVALSLLDQWQILAPLYSYTELAETIGDEGGRRRTRDVIYDLRVPIYQTDMLFVRRDETTRQFMALWIEDTRATEDDPRLTFLRTLFEVKPLILAVPTIWWTDAK